MESCRLATSGAQRPVGELQGRLEANECESAIATCWRAAQGRPLVARRASAGGEMYRRVDDSSVSRHKSHKLALNSQAPATAPSSSSTRTTISRAFRRSRLAILLTCLWLAHLQLGAASEQTPTSTGAPSTSAGSGSLASSVLMGALEGAQQQVAAAMSKQPEVTGSEPGPGQKSIVASLSSAVASAAAAAAVAAAQSSLSGGDARSLLSPGGRGSAQNPAGHTPYQRSPGIQLALKLAADSIPEVPYNILHNMKKVDHAAPFYNLPNRVSPAGTKESSSASSAGSYLANSLLSAAAGSRGDQLVGVLLKSPLLRRLADGYGDFASEFRSLFRAPGGTPMKGTGASPTSRLIREISVPALLMLVASAIPSEWRPGKTRRKSPLIGDSLAAATQDLASFSSAPQLMGAPLPVAPRVAPTFDQLSVVQPELPGAGDLTMQDSWQHQFRQPQQQGQTSPTSFQTAQQPPVDYLNQSPNVQVQPAAQLSGQPQAQQAVQPQFQFQLQPQTGAPANVIRRRFGESSTNDDLADWSHNQQQLNSKPVQEEEHETGARHATGSNRKSASLSPSDHLLAAKTNGGRKWLSSLTSPDAPATQLVNRIINTNRELLHQLVATNSGAGQSAAPTVSSSSSSFSNEWARKDQLDDKHRYSLVGVDADPEALAFGGSSHHNNKQESSHHWLSGLARRFASVAGGSGSGSIVGVSSATSGAPLARQPHESLFEPARRHWPVEQRDLTQLLPNTWREAVKRTVNNVQQTATTQWRSIEGQLTNWVQDKLKTASPTATGSVTPGSTAGVQQVAANLFATVGNSAINMLGLSKSPIQSASSEQVANVSQKLDVPQRQSPTATNPANKGPLASVAELIVHTISHKLAPTSAQPGSSVGASVTASSEPSKASEKPAATPTAPNV